MSSVRIYSHANQINHFSTGIAEAGKPSPPDLTILPGANDDLDEDLIKLALQQGRDDPESFRARIERGEFDVKGVSI